jgi:hypothetical protein
LRARPSGGTVISKKAGTNRFTLTIPAETPLTYQYNTGIITAYLSEHAVSLIQANPIGFPLPVSGGS